MSHVGVDVGTDGYTGSVDGIVLRAPRPPAPAGFRGAPTHLPRDAPPPARARSPALGARRETGALAAFGSNFRFALGGRGAKSSRIFGATALLSDGVDRVYSGVYPVYSIPARGPVGAGRYFASGGQNTAMRRLPTASTSQRGTRCAFSMLRWQRGILSVAK